MVCDQCGSVEIAGARQSDSIDGESGVAGLLAVCKGPGCGVAFAQCQRCNTDYDGCCSAACQALALAARDTTNLRTVHGEIAQPPGAEHTSVGAFPGGDRRRRQPVPGSPSGRSRSAGSSVDEVQISKLEPPSFFKHGNVPPSCEGWVEGIDRGIPSQADKGSEASVTAARGGGEDGRGVSAAARRFSTGFGRDGRNGDLPVVDSEDYASRHSIPESKSLAKVREATSRCGVRR